MRAEGSGAGLDSHVLSLGVCRSWGGGVGRQPDAHPQCLEWTTESELRVGPRGAESVRGKATLPPEFPAPHEDTGSGRPQAALPHLEPPGGVNWWSPPTLPPSPAEGVPGPWGGRPCGVHGVRQCLSLPCVPARQAGAGGSHRAQQGDCRPLPDTMVAESGSVHADRSRVSEPVALSLKGTFCWQELGLPTPGQFPNSRGFLLPLPVHSSAPLFRLPLQSCLQLCHQVDQGRWVLAAQNPRFSPQPWEA